MISSSHPFSPEYQWIDNDRIANVMRSVNKSKNSPALAGSPNAGGDNGAPASRLPVNAGSRETNAETIEVDDESPPTFNSLNVQLHLGQDEEDITDADATKVHETSEEDYGRPSVKRFQRLSEERGGEDGSGQSGRTIVPHIMPEQEIMHKYWKLQVSSSSHSFIRTRYRPLLISLYVLLIISPGTLNPARTDISRASKSKLQ